MIERNPTKEHLDIILAWLEEEARGPDNQDSFLPNWPLIEEAFNEQRLYVFLKEELPVGFCVWQHSVHRVAGLNILSIHPDWRGKGIGSTFVQSLLSLQMEGVWAVIFESRKNKQGFWKQLGFQTFPPAHYYAKRGSEGFEKFYKALVPEKPSPGGHLLQLWYKNIHEVLDSDLPDVQVGINGPIVLPADFDWKAQILDAQGSVVVVGPLKRLVKDVRCCQMLLTAGPEDWNLPKKRARAGS